MFGATWSQFVEALGAVASTFGLKTPLLVGFLGAVVSLRFVADMTTWQQRLGTAFGGALCANYGAPLAVDWFGVQSQGGESSIAFLIGLFGMSLAAASMKLISDGELWQIIKSRIPGGGK